MADKDKPLRPYRAAPPDPSPQAVLLAALQQRLPARAAHIFAGIGTGAGQLMWFISKVGEPGPPPPGPLGSRLRAG